MNIIIIANFPGFLDGSYSDRICYLANLFNGHGHFVDLVVSDFCHENKEIRKIEAELLYPFKITMFHERPYTRNVSLMRLRSHWAWGKNVEEYLESQSGIDCIYCAIPSLTAAYKAAKYAKRKGVKFVVDLQDLWPEAFAMAIKNSFLQKLFLPMKWYADKIYSAADLAVAVSETYIDRILSVNHKLHDGISVYLGNNGEEFDRGRTQYRLDRSNDEYVVGYIGNMSTSYDIPMVFDALAKVAQRKNIDKQIRFVLIGGGVDEDKFKEYGKCVYPNHTFMGRRNYQEMAGMVSDCDIVVNPIVKGSVASIINKVGDYALSGVPVINTQESEEYRKLVETYHCGINCRCGNSDDVADAIERLLSNPALRKSMSEGQKRLGKEKFDRRYTYSEIVNGVESLFNH